MILIVCFVALSLIEDALSVDAVSLLRLGRCCRTALIEETAYEKEDVLKRQVPSLGGPFSY